MLIHTAIQHKTECALMLNNTVCEAPARRSLVSTIMPGSDNGLNITRQLNSIRVINQVWGRGALNLTYYESPPMSLALMTIPGSSS